MPVSFTIARRSPAIELTSSNGSTVFGQTVTFVARVSAAGSSGGTVTFSDGASPLATVAIDRSGSATLTTTGLAIGSHAITATYNGNADFLEGRSGMTTESVTQDATTLVVVPHANYKKKRLRAISVTAEIDPMAPGGGVPTGVVTFEIQVKRRRKITMKALGTTALNGGQATLTFKRQKLFKKTLTIVYGGDVDFESASKTLPKLTRKSLK